MLLGDKIGACSRNINAIGQTCARLHASATVSFSYSTAGEPSLPRMIPESDMHALLLHLPPSSQSVAHELYVLDSNVHSPPESCYGLLYPVDGAAEAAYVLRDIGDVLDFSNKANALRMLLHGAACAHWDLSDDVHGRFALLQVLFFAGAITFLTRPQRSSFQTPHLLLRFQRNHAHHSQPLHFPQ